MSAHGFKSVYMVGAIATAALGCYLVSLRVASERAALESVENKIVLAQRDIRLLNTEIDTRGRLAQLERWNVKVIRLSAPTADQFVESSFQLATLAKPDRTPAVEAPLVYAAAPAPARRDPVVTSDDGEVASPRPSRPLDEMMHVASYSRPTTKSAPAGVRPEVKPDTRADAKAPGIAAVKPKPKPAAAKLAKSATADPLGPLSGAKSQAKGSSLATATRTTPQATKESGSD